MAIRRKGTGWQVDVTWRGRRAPRITVATEREARIKESEFQTALMRGEAVTVEADRSRVKATSRVATLGLLADYACDHHWRGKKSFVTSQRTAYAWVDRLGRDFPTSGLAEAVIEDVCHQWATEGNQDGTINRKLAALSIMLRYAVREGELSVAPKLPKKREYEGRIRYYSEAEEAHFLDYFRGVDPEFVDLCTVAADTGCRYEELMKLTPRDVGQDGKTITIWVNKGDKPSTLPLTPRAQAVIAARVEGIRDWEGIFPRRLTSRVISRLIERWREAAGLPKDDEACFHSWRHTCCSRLVQRGVSLATVQRWMRHKDIKTTMRYAHLAPNAFDDALRALC